MTCKKCEKKIIKDVMVYNWAPEEIDEECIEEFHGGHTTVDLKLVAKAFVAMGRAK